ncbi:MAG TPA: HAD-IB family phosphatase [Candidatus Binatia bacterium]|nr:HAD-IB family phosphatase [Candidatus Binatia bacterium]
MSASLHVFTDFDGTITERDTLVFLTERLGGGERVQQTNVRLARDGRISLRQCIAGNMRSIRAPFAEAAALLRAHVALDPTFAPFAAWCAGRKIPLTVLSAGFREIIDLYLAPGAFPGVEIVANRLEPDERTGWRCVFRDRSDTGHDKAAAVRAAQRDGRRAVFIGDGMSDRAPAGVADAVFAKAGLAAWCRERGIACREFRSFDDVRAALAAELSGS